MPAHRPSPHHPRPLAPEVLGLAWPDFLEWFGPRWEPSQHVAIIAPTGQGKTTVLCGILGLRNYVLALDPKGGDSTLAATGYPRLSKWPPPKKVYDAMAEKKPQAFRVGPVVRTRLDRPRLKAVLREALLGAFDDGGWTLAVDEFQLAADRRMMNLGTEVEELLIAARDKGLSVVTLFQAPRWVPRAASDMASWVFVGMTRDVDVISRLAEILGRPKAEIRGAVEGLGSVPFSWLVAGNNPREPLVVTIPDKAIAPARVARPAIDGIWPRGALFRPVA